MTVSPESSLIQTYFAPLAGPAGLCLGDDAACLTPNPGHDLVLTTDTIVEGRHFLATDDPFDVAIKAVTVNLSDLVAKGAQPLGYLLALSLPGKPTDAWMMRFASGLALQVEGLLLGGDTTVTDGPLTITITAIGEVPSGRMVKRSGAKTGDLVFVTGNIGTSAMGLKFLNDKAWADLTGFNETEISEITRRYSAPMVDRPKEQARFICDHASASLDISDGLALDLGRLCAQSGAGAEIDLRCLPLHPLIADLLARELVTFEELITGGDDYVALISIAPARLDDINIDQLPFALTRIGTITHPDKGLVWRQSPDSNLVLKGRTGYDHFA